MNEVWTDILTADYSWLLFSLVLAVMSHIFRALRWNLLIDSLNYQTRTSTTFMAVMVGYLVNTAVPRAGEFARCGILSKKEKIPFNALFGTVISERLFDLITLLVIIFLVIVFQIQVLGGFMKSTFGPFFNTVFSNITDIIIFSLLSLAILALIVFLVIFFKEKIKQLPFYGKIREFLDGLFDGIKTIGKMKKKWLFLLYTFMIWLFYSLMVYVPVFMLPETSQLTYVDALTILAIGSLGIVAPVPGGIGAYHFIVKAVLVEIFNIGGNAAGSFAAITHAGQTILNVVLGAISYFYIGLLSRKEKSLNG